MKVIERSKYELITKLKKAGMTIRIGKDADQVAVVYASPDEPVAGKITSSHQESILMDKITLSDWLAVDVYKDLFKKYLQQKEKGISLSTQEMQEIEKLKNS